jgi:hypothetical protein
MWQVVSPSQSGVSAVNSVVAFYDIHRRKGEALFFGSVPDTTRGKNCYAQFVLLSAPQSRFILYVLNKTDMIGGDVRQKTKL